MSSSEQRANRLRSINSSSDSIDVVEAIDALVEAIDIDNMGDNESDAISTLVAYGIIEDPRIRTYRVSGHMTVTYDIVVTTNMTEIDLEEEIATQMFNAVDEAQERVFDNPNDQVDDVDVQRWFTDMHGLNIART
jgi:hypothetical protein